MCNYDALSQQLICNRALNDIKRIFAHELVRCDITYRSIYLFNRATCPSIYVMFPASPLHLTTKFRLSVLAALPRRPTSPPKIASPSTPPHLHPLACSYSTDARGQSHHPLACSYSTDASGQSHPLTPLSMCCVRTRTRASELTMYCLDCSDFATLPPPQPFSLPSLPVAAKVLCPPHRCHSSSPPSPSQPLPVAAKVRRPPR